MACHDLQVAEIERLEKLVYVPGHLRCAKCEFYLVSNFLNAGDGTISANNKPNYCPNCNVPHWRVTERDAGNLMVDRCEEQLGRAAAAEAQLTRYKAAIEFYADPRTYVSFPGDNDTSLIEQDEGERARAVLAGKAAGRAGEPSP